MYQANLWGSAFWAGASELGFDPSIIAKGSGQNVGLCFWDKLCIKPDGMLCHAVQTVEVPMMFQKFTARDMTGERQVFYANISGLFKAVRLPYRHSNISAVALLPDKAKYGLDVDAAAVDLAELGLLSTARWRTMYSVGQLNLQLPKFTSKTDQIPLKKVSSNIMHQQSWRSIKP